MLKHYPKLKKLCTRNGKVDMRKMRSKAFMKEMCRIVEKSVRKTGIKKVEYLINSVVNNQEKK